MHSTLDKTLVALIGLVSAYSYMYLSVRLDLDGWDMLGTLLIYASVMLFIIVYSMLKVPKEKLFFTQDLFRQRMILVTGRIKESEAPQIMAQIRYLSVKNPNRPIKLLIDSEGGSAGALRTILNGIKASRAPVDGIVVGVAFSAATLLLQACRNRYALPYSTIMIHDPGFDFEVAMGHQGSIKEGCCDNFLKDAHEQVEAVREGVRREKGFCDDILFPRTQMTREKYAEIEEKFLKPEEALELNLIDKIITTY